MRDRSLNKILFRIINLFVYIIYITLLTVCALTGIYHDNKIIMKFFSNYMIVIIVCAVLTILAMIIVLVLKYTYQEEKRLYTYRLADTIVRVLCTVPISLCICYYIFELTQFGELFNLIVGILLFVILNWLIRLGMQEAFETAYVINDNL